MIGPVDFDPSPTAWAAELQAFLIKDEVVYRSLTNDPDRRRYATLVLGLLYERLDRIPALNGVLSASVCRDMLDFLDDLDRGRDHPWRSLGPYGGLQQYTTQEERVRAQALIGVEILVDAAGSRRGAKKEAFAKIAAMSVAAGHDLSAARIKGLYYEYKGGRFPRPELIGTFVDRFWMGRPGTGDIARCEHGHPVQRCRDSGGGHCSDIERVAGTYIGGIFLNV